MVEPKVWRDVNSKFRRSTTIFLESTRFVKCSARTRTIRFEKVERKCDATRIPNFDGVLRFVQYRVDSNIVSLALGHCDSSRFERKYDALRSRNFDGKFPTSIFCDLSLKPLYVSYASFVRSHIEYASIKSNARRLGKSGADNMHRRFFLGFACRERKNLGVKKIRFCAWKN
jgi:hypothetical protein